MNRAAVETEGAVRVWPQHQRCRLRSDAGRLACALHGLIACLEQFRFHRRVHALIEIGLPQHRAILLFRCRRFPSGRVGQPCLILSQCRHQSLARDLQFQRERALRDLAIARPLPLRIAQILFAIGRFQRVGVQRGVHHHRHFTYRVKPAAFVADLVLRGEVRRAIDDVLIDDSQRFAVQLGRTLDSGGFVHLTVRQARIGRVNLFVARARP